MKTTLLFAVAALASATASAQVDTIFMDAFNYLNGDLTAVSGGIWTAHADSGQAPVQDVTGAVVLVQGSGVREDVSVPLSDSLSAGEIFTAMFDLVVSGSTLNSSYFASFKDSTASAVSARLFVTPPTIAGGDYSLGISNTGLTTDATLLYPFFFGVTYRPSLSINANTGLGTLAIEQTTVTTTTINGNAVSTFALYQRNGGATQVIDNLLVTRTVAPEPTSALMFVCGIGFLGVLRHRRRAS